MIPIPYLHARMLHARANCHSAITITCKPQHNQAGTKKTPGSEAAEEGARSTDRLHRLPVGSAVPLPVL